LNSCPQPQRAADRGFRDAGSSADLEAARAATEFLDYDSPQVREYVSTVLPSGDLSPREQAVRLYYAVRDQVRYDVYGADLSREGMRASSILEAGHGFCLHKSILYAAAVRSVGIPSRLVLTDVCNHLASPRLKRLVGGDVFHFHCLAEVNLDGRWIKATPVFNKLLCRLYGIKPLEFDGINDSLHHPYDEQGRRSMEFLRYHGEFTDFPYEMVIDGLTRTSPRLFRDATILAEGSLVTEALAA
jgi:transglutaminase-like putative cysteine protease